MSANPIERLDTPLAQVEADALSLQKLWTLQVGSAAEQRHQLDPFDGAFAALACAHPEACACPADYPDWRPGGAA